MHGSQFNMPARDFNFQTEELRMRVQQQNGDDHTSSTLRESGHSDNGVVLRRPKSRAQQDIKSEQENFGVDVCVIEGDN